MPPEAPVTSARLPVRSNIACLISVQPSRAQRQRRPRPACRRQASRQPSAIRLASPDSTLPAPISTKSSTPAAASQAIALAPAHHAGHLLDQLPPDLRRVADRRRRRRWRRAAPAAARAATCASASAITSAAGAISAQWKGALTGSRIARLAPLALAISTARSTAARSPETTTWPGPLSLAACADLALGAPPRRPARGCVEVEPEQRRHGALADRHGLLHGPAADAEQPRRIGEVEAARRGQRGIFAERVAGDVGDASAERRRPRASSTRSAAMLTAISAGWAFSVRVSSRPGPPRSSPDSFSPSASSTSSKTARASGKASASALPMPTAWLPWPGKVNATVIRLARRTGFRSSCRRRRGFQPFEEDLSSLATTNGRHLFIIPDKKPADDNSKSRKCGGNVTDFLTGAG